MRFVRFVWELGREWLLFWRKCNGYLLWVNCEGGLNEQKISNSTFEDLKVWQVAKKVRNEIFELVKKFPASEKFRLTDQIFEKSKK
ncbi:MAG: four helix bundle protein [Balneolaceae bacterium]